MSRAWRLLFLQALRRSVVAGLVVGGGVVAAAEPEPTLWFDNANPAAQALQAVELLEAAASQGLNPPDYDAQGLQRALAQAQGLSPEALAKLDQALTGAIARYLSDLHQGRVAPLPARYRPLPPAERFDAAAYLRTALLAHRLPQAAEEAAPRVPGYAPLREALARYRAMGAPAAWQQPLPPLPAVKTKGHQSTKLEPGQDWAGVAVLAQRLGVLGDLLPQDAVHAERYDNTLVEAVRSFQKRHGLEPDGVLGKTTWALLQVSPAQRVRQIELALERLRSTPLMQGPRMVVVNIPEFKLRAFERADGALHLRAEMKVIVGQAKDKRTPLFDEDMRSIEFSPYWNVPSSIARAELLPKLRSDPAYLAREGMELVGEGGQVSTALSATSLDEVLAGSARIRQRPGARNALGDIKFVFPNHDNIYLHHTPSTGLFARERRDFSHGCIRVEQPEVLASFVLQGMPDWTPERIRQMMRAGKSSTLRLAEPIPVVLAYQTALVIDDRIHFFDDIYGHDRLLDNALRQHSQRLTQPTTP